VKGTEADDEHDRDCGNEGEDTKVSLTRSEMAGLTDTLCLALTADDAHSSGRARMRRREPGKGFVKAHPQLAKVHAVVGST